MMRSRAVSAAETNQSRSVALDGSLPTASVSLASTALLISEKAASSSVTAAGAAGRTGSVAAGSRLRSSISCIPHVSCPASVAPRLLHVRVATPLPRRNMAAAARRVQADAGQDPLNLEFDARN